MNNNEPDCWNFKNCPSERQENCPAKQNNAGKKCWLVTGTMCGGIKQGSIQEKLAKCHECNFFKSRNGVPG